MRLAVDCSLSHENRICRKKISRDLHFVVPFCKCSLLRQPHSPQVFMTKSVLIPSSGMNVGKKTANGAYFFHSSVSHTNLC